MLLDFILSAIVCALKDLIPAQHSDYWYNIRRYRVGASEIATYIGLVSYDSLENKILEKINLGKSDFQSRFLNEACVWGNILEDVIRTHCEHEYNTVIHEVGSIPSLPGQSMSPDGLSIVNNEIILWEYKCPFSRELVPKTIPEYYIPQVLTGLETIPFCDYAIFVEAIIRRCPLTHGGGNKYYDMKYPNSYGRWKVPPFDYPLTWGAVAFTSKMPASEFDKINPKKPAYNLFKFMIDSSANGPIDFGSCEPRYMRDLFEIYAEGYVEVKYIYQQHPDKTVQTQLDEYTKADILTEAATNLDGKLLFGVMRWKMIQKNVMRVDRRPGYLAATNKYANIVNECVRLCDKMDDDRARMIKISETANRLRSLANNDDSIKITEPYAYRKMKDFKKTFERF
jgi:hypothetical protein